MKNERLTRALERCNDACNTCADACLEEENVTMMVKCIRSDRVCAEVCRALKEVLAIKFKDIQGLIDYCIQVCNTCAEECEKHEHQHCKECAKACRECADECTDF